MSKTQQMGVFQRPVKENEMALTMFSRIVRSNNPVSAPVDDELVMADVDAGKYYGLNSIATTIWQSLETPVTVEELCSKLCESFDVSKDQCSKETLAFLTELESRKLISVEG